MKKLEEAIIYVLSKQPAQQMEILRLAKYLYLADYMFAKTFGRKKTFTGMYSRYPYGPVPTKFYLSIESLSGIIRRDGNIMSLVKKDNSTNDLSEEEMACLDKTVDDFSSISLKKLLTIAYATEPMKKMIEREKSIGSELHFEELDFDCIKTHTLLDSNKLNEKMSEEDLKKYLAEEE